MVEIAGIDFPDKERVTLLLEGYRAPVPARRAAAILLLDIIRIHKPKADFGWALQVMHAAQRPEVAKELRSLAERFGLAGSFTYLPMVEPSN